MRDPYQTLGVRRTASAAIASCLVAKPDLEMMISFRRVDPGPANLNRQTIFPDVFLRL